MIRGARVIGEVRLRKYDPEMRPSVGKVRRKESFGEVGQDVRGKVHRSGRIGRGRGRGQSVSGQGSGRQIDNGRPLIRAQCVFWAATVDEERWRALQRLVGCAATPRMPELDGCLWILVS